MSRAEAKARTREVLLDSARQVFAEKGFNAATIEEIVAKAGFTRGAFYANFADKRDVFWAVADSEDAELFGAIESDLETARQGGDEELSLLDRWFGRLLGGSPLQQAYAEVGAQPAGDEDRQRMARLLDANRTRIATVIEAEATARGVRFAVSPEHLAAIFLGLGNGLGQQHTVDPDAVPLSLIADAFAFAWLGAAQAADDPSVLSRGSGTPPQDPPPRGRRRS